MKIVIKNPAPVGPKQQKWGDFHFGRSLAKYLERLGVETETHYYPHWAQQNRADAVLVLRGKYQYQPSDETVNVLWCMSNPSTVTVQEYDSYDAVCVASHTHARYLREQTRAAVYALLQCTDPEAFEIEESGTVRDGPIFVGNSRGVRRSCLAWAISFGLDVQIYGRGWREWQLGDQVVADYVANEDLPQLYARSSLTFNDHWHDMKHLGYINNRIFDGLAAGVIMITDDFPELREVCGDALLYYDDQASFNAALTEALVATPAVAKRQRALWREIREEFSFERRAEHLHEIVGELGRTKNNGRPLISRLKRPPDDDPTLPARLDVIEADLQQGRTGRYCPLCGNRSDAFLPGGASTRRSQARCPNCGALERHRLFWTYLVNDLWPRLPSGLKQLLHVAPEEHLSRLLHAKDDVNYLSGDLMMPNVMVRLDLTDIEFPGDRFDVIVCSHILEHIPDDEVAMREMYRVTKPGGFTLVQVPLYGPTTYEDPSVTEPEDRLAQFGQRDHVRKYGADLGERLARAGFEVSARSLATELPAQVVQYLGLKNQVIFECGKQAPAGA